jgi:hypothetical protein
MRLFRMAILFQMGSIAVAGCSNVNAREVKSVTLECIQECLRMENKPFDKKEYKDKESIALFAKAVNQAGKIEGVLDYAAYFRMTFRMKNGNSSEYFLNIGYTDRPQNGLLVKLPDSEHGYSISQATSEKLKKIVYE